MKRFIVFILLISSLHSYGQAVKISDMPAASALSGTELVPIVQSGVNKKATVSQFQSGFVNGSGTTNELVYWTGASTLGNLPVATYPDLTELSYLKGLTSPVQGQLDGKWSLASGGTLTGNNTITQGGFNTTFSGIGRVTFSPTSTSSGLNFGVVSGTPSGLVAGDAYFLTLNNTYRGYNGTNNVYFIGSILGLTANRIPYASALSILTESANLTFDGTGLLVGGGTITANTRVDNRGTGTTTNLIERWADASNNQRASITDAGIFTIGTLTGRVQFLDVAVNGIAVNFPSNNAGFGLVTSGGLFARHNSNQGFTIGSGAVSSSTATLQVSQNGHASSFIPAFKLDAGAHTNVTASELNDINFNLNRTVQFTGSTGFATQRAFVIQAPTYSFASPTGTITTASTLEINGGPTAGTNAIITNPYALRISSGNSFLGGKLFLNTTSTDNALTDLLTVDPTTKEVKIRTVASLPGGGGSGDVVGPASATDNAIARFDLTTGKLIQNSAVTIDDTGSFAVGTDATNIRTFAATGSTANHILRLQSKGTGSTSSIQLINDGGEGLAIEPSSTPIARFTIGTATLSASNITGTSSTASTLVVQGGNGLGTNDSGGDLTLKGGGKTGSGVEGSVIIQTATGKVGIYGVTPVVRPAAVTTMQGLATAISSTGLINTSTLTGDGLALGANGTDANLTAAVNTSYYLPAATLTANRNFVMPTGADGDVIKIHNNEAGFVWNLTGGSVYYSDGVTIATSLLANANYEIEKRSGKWRIQN